METAVSGAGVLLLGAGCGSGEKGQNGSDEEISPTEDLMREHGLLNRILLVYDHAARKLDSSEALDLRWVANAAGIVKRFIEEYHEVLEEQYVFPKLLRAGKEADLVNVLRTQHDAGRRVTAEILDLATPATASHPEAKKKLETDLRLFVRMYRPHEAREDTVLFPELRKVAAGRELEDLGEIFEKREQDLFGKDGFERMVGRTAEIEKALGLYDLQQFTP